MQRSLFVDMICTFESTKEAIHCSHESNDIRCTSKLGKRWWRGVAFGEDHQSSAAY